MFLQCVLCFNRKVLVQFSFTDVHNCSHMWFYMKPLMLLMVLACVAALLVVPVDVTWLETWYRCQMETICPLTIKHRPTYSVSPRAWSTFRTVLNHQEPVRRSWLNSSSAGRASWQTNRGEGWINFPEFSFHPSFGSYSGENRWCQCKPK